MVEMVFKNSVGNFMLKEERTRLQFRKLWTQKCKSLMSWLYLVRTGWIIVTFTLSLWSMPDWIQWLSSCAESWVSLWGLHLLFSGFFERKPQSRKSSDQKVSESPHTSRLKCPNLHHLKAYLQPSTKRFGLNSFIVFHRFNRVVVVLVFFLLFFINMPL